MCREERECNLGVNVELSPPKKGIALWEMEYCHGGRQWNLLNLAFKIVWIPLRGN